MKIRELTDYLNRRFLPVYQESYDNAGFLLGDDSRELTGVLTTVDVTPDVVEEAVDKSLNLIVSHHPLIFGDMKRITPANATGRMVMRLMEKGIAVYAAHTNLDNLDWGINGILAEKLGLTDCHILRPVEGVLRKLATYVPTAHADNIRQALFAAGAGGIGGYDCCSYNSEGFGTFRAGDDCHPFCGEKGEIHQEAETRIEVIYEKRLERKLMQQLKAVHPYEEPAIDLIPLNNKLEHIGAGMVGNLSSPMDTSEFLERVKKTLHLPVIRCSSLCKKQVSKIAICGGSGSFLIPDAKNCAADMLLTADLKYHDFQSAENEIILADIGHYESEQFAKELFYRVISEKFSTFACRISEQNNGFVYYI